METKWIVNGQDRAMGAIGILQPFSIVVHAENEDAARDKAREARYADNREHVHITRCLPAES